MNHKDLFYLFNFSCGESQDVFSSNYSSIVWVTGMVDERQGGVESHSYLDDLVPCPITRISDKLGHLERNTATEI